MESGWYILGKQVSEFENEFAEYCGLPFAAGVNSGTDALYLALLACGVGKGDEVIAVPNTAVPTVCAIRMAGAIPVFCDVEEDSLLMDPALIESRITRKTKAILPVHLYGRMCRMDIIMQIARAHDLKVVEDACQAHGAEWSGKRSGNFGDAACYSFYPSKNLGAFGDGGMVVTKEDKICEKVKMLRNYGQKERYLNVTEGVNSRLDEIQAAVLRSKLSRLDEWNNRRREIAALYRNGVRNPDIIHPTAVRNGGHVNHLYVIRTRYRQSLQTHLRDREIGTAIHYPIPIYKQEAYHELFAARNKCPVAEVAADQILSIPIYPELTDEEVHYIIDCLNAWNI